MTVKVKICGITSPEQALMAQQAGADALGLVVYSNSSRYVDIQRAAEIRAVIGPETMAVVLLVNADEATVKQVIAEVKPDLLQFHGDETPAFCQQFGFPFIRAIRMREGLDLDAEVAAYHAEGGYLFDAWSDDQYGGTGHQFDWTILANYRGQLPWMLAGGLDRHNVANAIKISAAKALDVSSGVESYPGKKDAEQIHAFIRAAQLG